MKILDCTLRDGGYYTNWDFDKNLVDNYIDSLRTKQRAKFIMPNFLEGNQKKENRKNINPHIET